ncbi:MAG: DNA polymerase-1 [Hyphomicrobiaceae bacterium]
MSPSNFDDAQLSFGLNEHQRAHESAAALLASEGVRVVLVRNTGDAELAFRDLAEADGPIGLDLETAATPRYRSDPRAGLDPLRSRIRLAQFYGGASTCWVFDFDAVPPSILAPAMELTMVAHNAAFETVHLLAAGLRPQRLGCTLLAENALNGGLVSLANLAKQRLQWTISKELQQSDWSAVKLSDGQLAYAALDAVCVQRLATAMADELRSSPAQRTYRLMRDALPTIAHMELGGIAFDLEGHEQLVERWRHALGTAEDELRLLLGDRIDFGSSTQLADWLSRNLDSETLAAWPKTKTGRLRTAAGTLARYPDHPLVAPLLAHREASVRLSSFGPGFAEWVNPETRRIHANYRVGATPSGRMASMRPNLQNPPREHAFRALFHAPQGRSLVVADYSQIELRVAALLSGDRLMLQAYERGEDLHRATAAAITGLPIAEIDAEARQLAKAVNFGLLFGQGARGLAAYARSSYGVAMTEAQATIARQAFFDTWPELAAWQRKVGRDAERTGTVTTPGGRPINLRRGGREVHYTEALNTPVQGGAAEILMAALGRLRPLLEHGRAMLVNVVHDELVLEVDDESAAEIAAEVEDAMINGMLDIFPAAPTVGLVEAGIGATWADAK